PAHCVLRGHTGLQSGAPSSRGPLDAVGNSPGGLAAPSNRHHSGGTAWGEEGLSRARHRYEPLDGDLEAAAEAGPALGAGLDPGGQLLDDPHHGTDRCRGIQAIPPLSEDVLVIALRAHAGRPPPARALLATRPAAPPPFQ